jgi:Zn-dependent protease
MRESIRLGRVLGIPVGVNWTLLVIVGLLTYDLALGLPGGLTAAAVAVSAVAALVFFASVLLHELAHSVVARRYGLRVDGITLWLLGGVSRLDGEVPSAKAEFRIAVAGPATSAALAVGFAGLNLAGGGLGLPAVITGALGWLALINGVVAVFNLAPAAPLDGGRVLGAALWARNRDRDRAQLGAARAGRVFGWLLVGLGFATFVTGAGVLGLWPALLGWFVLSLADAEARYYRLRLSTRGRTVGDVMTPVIAGQPGWLTVDAFLGQVEGRGASAFLVDRWEGGPAGLVGLDQLRAVPPEARGHTRVLDLAGSTETLASAARGEDLATAWARATGPRPGLLVHDDGRVVGVVTPEDLRRGAPARPEAAV